MSTTNPGGITVIRYATRTAAGEERPSFPGISTATAGAQHLTMYVGVVPAGEVDDAHIHKGYETGVYILSGRIEMRYGPGLQRSVFVEAGGFLFMPPEVPHQTVNLSPSEPARVLVAMSVPAEQEHEEPYDPSAEA
jgi:uncharacterized RmlC-like cupin family protein